MHDIVDTAVAAGSFTTLVTAVKAAGLVDTLKSAGPFTVFAPTDEAFAKLPEGTLAAVLADKEKLTAILTYHVVAGKVMAKDVVGLNGKTATTVQGGALSVDTTQGVKDRRGYRHQGGHRVHQRRDPCDRHRAHPELKPLGR